MKLLDRGMGNVCPLRAFELLGPGSVKVLSFVSLIYVPVLNYTVETVDIKVRGHLAQQSKFDCLIQDDSSHNSGSFNICMYLPGPRAPVIKMSALVSVFAFSLGTRTDVMK